MDTIEVKEVLVKEDPKSRGRVFVEYVGLDLDSAGKTSKRQLQIMLKQLERAKEMLHAGNAAIEANIRQLHQRLATN